jgi:hypothetical protein
VGYYLAFRLSTAELDPCAARIRKEHVQFVQSWSRHQVSMAAPHCHNVCVRIYSTAHQVHILDYQEVQVDQTALQSEKAAG